MWESRRVAPQSIAPGGAEFRTFEPIAKGNKRKQKNSLLSHGRLAFATTGAGWIESKMAWADVDSTFTFRSFGPPRGFGFAISGSKREMLGGQDRNWEALGKNGRALW